MRAELSCLACPGGREGRPSSAASDKSAVMPNGQRWGTELRRGDVRLPYSPATRSGLPIEDIVAGCEGEESNGLFSSRGAKSLKGGRKLASQASLVSFCACPVPTDRFLAYPACHTWRPLFPCMSSVTAALGSINDGGPRPPPTHCSRTTQPHLHSCSTPHTFHACIRAQSPLAVR